MSCSMASPRRSAAISTLESRIRPNALIPRRGISRLAIGDDLSHVGCKLGVHDNFITPLFGPGLGHGKRLGQETAARWFCGTKNSYWVLVGLDDNFKTGANTRHQVSKIACRLRLGDVISRHRFDHTSIEALLITNGYLAAEAWINCEASPQRPWRKVLRTASGVQS